MPPVDPLSSGRFAMDATGQMYAYVPPNMVPISTGGTSGGGSQRSTFSNTDHLMTVGDTIISQTGTMSAVRTVTLQAASTCGSGWSVLIVDESGSVSGTNFLQLVPHAGDTINKATTKYIVPATPYGFVELVSDGASNWTVVNRKDDLTINARSIGAMGDGATDDTAAIQAAINACATLGRTSSISSARGGTVFFPPGAYQVTKQLTCNIANARVRLAGSSRYNCVIFGSFCGYIVNTDDRLFAGAIDCIEELTIDNTYSGVGAGPACGAVTMNLSGSAPGKISRCVIGGYTGVLAAPYGFDLDISDCNISSSTTSGTVGSVGVYGAQIGLHNCSVQGYDLGVAFSNAGNAGVKTRMETCNTGWMLGKGADIKVCSQSSPSGGASLYVTDIGATTLSGLVQGATVTNQTHPSSIPPGTTVSGISGNTLTLSNPLAATIPVNDLIFFATDYPATGVFIGGASTERCNTSIHFYNCSGVSVAGMALTGIVNVAATQCCDYGMRFTSASHVNISGCSISGSHAKGDISFNGASSLKNITISNVTGSNGTSGAAAGAGAPIGSTTIPMYPNNVSWQDFSFGPGGLVFDTNTPAAFAAGTKITAVDYVNNTITVSPATTAAIGGYETIAVEYPGFDLSNAPNNSQAITFANCQSIPYTSDPSITISKWTMPSVGTTAACYRFNSCNNPVPQYGPLNGPAGCLNLCMGLTHITANGNFSISGFTGPNGLPSSQNLNGEEIIIKLTSTFAMTLKNEDATQYANQRIRTMTGVDIGMAAGNSIARFIYNGIDQRWIMESGRDSAGPK